jgi:hypothetical protein
MTPALLLARDCIIYSVSVWLVPVECAFNLIESELVRRGVQLYSTDSAQCAPRTTVHAIGGTSAIIAHADKATGQFFTESTWI